MATCRGPFLSGHPVADDSDVSGLAFPIRSEALQYSPAVLVISARLRGQLVLDDSEACRPPNKNLTRACWHAPGVEGLSGHLCDSPRIL